MLVSCQICAANISDQAVACPKCGSPKSAFLGPETECHECGVRAPAAYRTCAECGAPRSISPVSGPGLLHPAVSPVRRSALDTEITKTARIGGVWKELFVFSVVLFLSFLASGFVLLALTVAFRLGADTDLYFFFVLMAASASITLAFRYTIFTRIRNLFDGISSLKIAAVQTCISAFGSILVQENAENWYFTSALFVPQFVFSAALFLMLQAPKSEQSLNSYFPPKKSVNEPDDAGLKAAIFASAVMAIFSLLYPATPDMDLSHRIAQAIGSGLTVLTLSSLSWLLTAFFHRIPFLRWHRISGWPVFWITTVSLFAIITDRATD
jgi:hypothetical protein